MKKYPHYGAHRWDTSKKYICTDFRHPQVDASLAQFVLSYSPSSETSSVADLVQRTLQTLLPGCRVARDPSFDAKNFRLTRLNDARLIAEVADSPAASDAILALADVGNFKSKDNLRSLVAAARFW